MKWSPLAEKVHQFLIRNTLLKQNDKILLAVSGGMDSVVMLAVFLELRDRWKWELIVGHIDHGLRPGEDEKESQLCRELAKKNDLQYVEEKVDLKNSEINNAFADSSTQNSSIESLARDVRYKIFSKWMNNLKCDALCTAHHANDQAETVLYRMLTGAGIKGLTGIPLSRDYIKRPLLPFLRKEIEDYAKENRIRYFEDHSNANEKFARNKIRHSVLPALVEMGFPQCESALADSSLALDEAAQVIDHYTNLETARILAVSGKDLKILIKEFLKLSPLIQKQILKNIFKNNLQIKKHISGKQLLQMNSFIISSAIGHTMELYGYELIRDRRHIIIKIKRNQELDLNIPCKEEKISIPDTGIEIEIKIVDVLDCLKTNNNTALFSTDIMGKECQLRTWKDGDKMNIFGSGNSKKISDILKDEKVNIADKKYWHVFLIDNDIVWVPGVKRSDQYVVNEKDDKMVKITYKLGAGK